MSPSEYKAKYGREMPTLRERQIAARIFVSASKRLRRESPEWIRKLAESGDRAA